MTQAQAHDHDGYQEEEISLIDLLIVLAKSKGMIIKSVLAAGLLSAAVVLLLPSEYTASTRILPPQQGQSAASAMLGQLGALAGMASSATGLKNPNDLYIGLLKTNYIEDAIIKRFKLKAYYDEKFQADARKELEKNFDAKAGKDGIITLAFTDRDPKLAAAVSNAYVEELARLNSNFAISAAAQRRVYYERQQALVKDELARAELNMKGTQERTGVLQPEVQGAAAIHSVAALQAQIAAKEVEMKSMRAFATASNPDYLRAQQELAGMREQYRRLDGGGRSEGVLMSTGKMPQAGLEYVRALRDTKYYESLYQFMSQQFEMAKADEAKEGALIQVIDPATPPEKRSSPKRTLTVLLSMVLAGFVAVLFAFVRESWRSAAGDARQARRLEELRRHLGMR